MRNKGCFISFEGVDGSGKSTQIEMLKEYLQNRNLDVIITREPGGTYISEKIREIILDPANDQMNDMTEAMLYAASRAQLVAQVIKPALNEGKVIICDRFVDSSIAYQGYGRRLGDSVALINSYAIGESMPDITFLLKTKPKLGAQRIENREKDRIEQEKAEFHNNVYDGYEKLAKEFPERIVTIDGSQSIEVIHEQIKNEIDKLLNYAV